ncbi:Phosphoglycerate mutase-like protein AT74 [Abeliophyllum distichum]|uniref:Phosphoglycerate mutase-like protein AT74 n=1 Tax=Abeliophyllum distichum TaxID=126358 RepID=A0ABD1UIY6_9LAMI
MTTGLFSTAPSVSNSPVIQRKPYNSTSIRCCEDSNPRINLKLPHDDNCLASFPEKNNYPSKQKPPRPRRIILVRHGQSEGNVDECVYTRVADPKIELTQLGISQAEECGREIREMIEKDGADDWKVYFYVSPYRRSLQTLRNLAKAFEKSRIAGVREEPRLREQDFGNFQDQEEMKIQKAVRMRYGRFFYRFPYGESAADVYDRITGFRETLRSDIDIGRFQPPGQQSPNMNYSDSLTWPYFESVS